MNDEDIDGMTLAKEQRMDDHPDNWGFKPPGDTRPTPETDAETMRCEYEHVDSEFGPYAPSSAVSADFARRLERERDAAYRTIQYLQKKHGT